MKPLADDTALLQAIYDTSSVAIFLVDMGGRIVHANRRMLEMFRCTRDELIGNEYVSLIHPFERESGRQKMLTLMARGADNVDLERRYWRRDGTEFWGNLTGKALYDGNGRATGLVGNIADIDQRKRAEQELSSSRERFERMADTVPCILYDYVLRPDGSSTFLYLNSRCQELFGLTAEALMADARLFWRLVHPEDLQRLQAEDRAATAGGNLFVSEFRIVTPAGQLRWIRASSRPNPPVAGQPAVWSGFMLDISASKTMEMELRQLATTDALTGLANRNHFLRQGQQEMERFRRTAHRAAVMMLDLDYFKHINDSFGHAAGDQVLRDFAQRVGAHLRNVDVFGRMGGEEFCILLPDTDLAGARTLGDRLCRAVGDQPARVEGQLIPYTVSIGVTEFRAGDRGFEPILARADAALYQAKRYGRNQVSAM